VDFPDAILPHIKISFAEHSLFNLAASVHISPSVLKSVHDGPASMRMRNPYWPLSENGTTQPLWRVYDEPQKKIFKKFLRPPEQRVLVARQVVRFY
jgi:hypothetical protein